MNETLTRFFDDHIRFDNENEKGLAGQEKEDSDWP